MGSEVGLSCPYLALKSFTKVLFSLSPKVW